MYRRILIILLTIAASPALAQQQESYNFELTPFGGYRLGGGFDELDGDNSINVDDSASYGLIFTARHSAITQWEVLWSQQRTTASTVGFDIDETELDLQFDYLQAGGTYLWDGDYARPYLAATVGVTRVAVENDGFDDDAFFSFGIGLGLQLRPTDRLGIRLEARGLGTLLDADTDIFCKSDPQGGLCAIRIDGNVMWQLETFAGLVFRF